MSASKDDQRSELRAELTELQNMGTDLKTLAFIDDELADVPENAEPVPDRKARVARDGDASAPRPCVVSVIKSSIPAGGRSIDRSPVQTRSVGSTGWSRMRRVAVVRGSRQ